MSVPQSLVDEAAGLYNALVHTPWDDQEQVASLRWRLMQNKRKGASLEASVALLLADLMQGNIGPARDAARDLYHRRIHMSPALLEAFATALSRLFMLRELEGVLQVASRLALISGPGWRPVAALFDVFHGQAAALEAGPARPLFEELAKAELLDVLPDVMTIITSELSGQAVFGSLDLTSMAEGGEGDDVLSFVALVPGDRAARRDIEERIAAKLRALYEANGLNVGRCSYLFSVSVLPLTAGYFSH